MSASAPLDGIELELFRNRFAGVAEEMGEALTRAALSPNIRERRDHSCALFDARGEMIAQAAHIPVHLGAAPACVKAVLERCPLADGETAIVNDPFAGGTHLPDITLVTAVGPPEARFYAATRAHHADVGGISPGSLPLARTIDEEGWRCPPVPLDDAVEAALLAASRTPWERRGDLAAQRGANLLGAERLRELVALHGARRCVEAGDALLDRADRAARTWIARAAAAAGITPGTERAVDVEDVLDDARGDGVAVPIRMRVASDGHTLRFDATASGDQVDGPMNAVRAIVESAVMYALVCCIGDATIANSGLMRCVTIVTRPGTVVDALPPAAVSAGNVETSQRLVDVAFDALDRLLALDLPAASYGSMNNVLIGGRDAAAPWVYYETLGGGHGGGREGKGASAMQAHMTNTLNTPIEALEHAFPLRIGAYAVRRGSGGRGASPGGDGLVRVYEALAPVEVTVVTERRRVPPPGRAGGGDGAAGNQRIDRANGTSEPLAGKATVLLGPGDQLRVETPGGGGWRPLSSA